MNSANAYRTVLFLSLLLLVASTTHAQADENSDFNAPNRIYYGSDTERVTMPMGDLSIRIPVLHKKGRGLDLDVVLSYHSHIWETYQYTDTSGDTFYITTNNTSIWNVGIPRMQFVDGYNVECYTYQSDGSCYQWVMYVILDSADGSVVNLGDDSGLHITGNLPTSFWSTNGSYIRMPNYSPSGSPGPLVYKDGVSLNFLANNSGGITTLEDTNGNEITCPGNVIGASGLCTDTLGDTVNIESPFVTYTDSSGNSQTITFTQNSLNISLPWADSTQNSDPNCTEYVPVTCYYVQPGYLGATTLLSSVTLPNGLSYGFQYVMNADGTTTGEVSKITLPTGGYIRYTYGCFNSVCTYPSDGQYRNVQSRIVSSDGTPASEQTWAYQIPTGPLITSITDPLGDVQSDVWSGPACPSVSGQTTYSNPAGQVVRQINRTASADTSDYTDPIPFPPCAPNSRPSTSITILPDTNQQSEVSYSYGTYNDVSDKYEYDWGNGTPGALLRHTHYTYLQDSNSAYGDLAAHIFDRVTSQQTYSGSGALMAQTNTTYDGASLSATSNIVQHDYTNYSSSNTARGNATSASQWLNTSNSWLTTTHSYNDVGNVLQTTDPNGDTTSYSYADNFYSYTPSNPTSAFLTQTTGPTTNGVAHVETAQFYFHSGLPSATCGENYSGGCNFGSVGPDYTGFQYDWNGRTTGISHADGGQSSIAYNESSTPISITSTSAISSGANLTATSVYDGLGRITQSQVNSDPSGTDHTDTTYDALGRTASVSNPYRTASDPTYGLTQYIYDSLNRIITTIMPDGSAETSSYTGSAREDCDEGNGTKPVCRVSQSDGLGRLVSVCEVTSAVQMGTAGTPGACGQAIPATGFLTAYLYDALDDMTQGSQSSLSPRVFQYDSLSRLVSASNPESGTTAYQYDSDSTCNASSVGDLISKTDARGIKTCYQYDQLHRLTGKSYSDGTPSAFFAYDQTCVNPPWYPGQALCQASGAHNLFNTIGRMSSEGTDRLFRILSYDPMGRVTNIQESFMDQPPGDVCATLGCGPQFGMAYSYDFLGDTTSLAFTDGQDRSGDPLDTTALTYAYNTAGQLLSISSSLSDNYHPSALVSAMYYDAPGHLVSDQLGNQIPESKTFNNRLWPTAYTATSAYQFALTYAPDGDVASSSDTANGLGSYSYDDFNRLLTTTRGEAGSYSYNYDQYGNRWQQNPSRGGFSSQLSFTANNHVDGFGYDPDGNVVNDGVHTYSYDAENRLISVDGGGTATYVYDGEGGRIEKTTASGTVGYLYDAEGAQFAEISSSLEPNRVEVYAGNRHLATYLGGSPGGTYFNHVDWLGTERSRTDATGSIAEACASLPFGDGQTCSATDPSPLHFTGKQRDTETASMAGNDGLDYFGARYNSSSVGRFTSPDPAGAEPDDPQSWNSYAYAANNPLSRTDPDGRDWYLLGGSKCGDAFDCDKEGHVLDSYGNAVVIKDEDIVNGTYGYTRDSNGNSFITIGGNGGNVTLQGQFYDPHPQTVQVCAATCDTPLNPMAQQVLPAAGRMADAGVKASMVLTLPEFLAAGGAVAITELAGAGGSLAPGGMTDLLGNQTLNRMIGPEERALLRQFFKSGERPSGLSDRALKLYRIIAKRAIEAGKDSGGEQARRLEMIIGALR